MKPDRVWAWAKGSIKGLNIYTPQDMVHLMNKVKSIKAEFVDHKSSKPFFVSGWKELAGKYFDNLPNRYTNNYYFEFENGTATVRRVCPPDTDAWTVRMCNNPLQTKKSLLLDLFGVEEVAAASFDRIRLPRTPLIELKEKKLESLASKYFSIPTDKLWYYSDIASHTTNTADQEEKTKSPDDITVQQLLDKLKEKNRQKKKKSQGKLFKAKAVGRPKGTKNVRVLAVPSGQKRILCFVNLSKV